MGDGLNYLGGDANYHVGNDWVRDLRWVNNPEQSFGVSGSEVPSVALESMPGDVVVFNHNLHHAAYGGGSWRRMFTLNLSRRAASPARMRHLAQVIENEDDLPALVK